jgi:hypothetical protein
VPNLKKEWLEGISAGNLDLPASNREPVEQMGGERSEQSPEVFDSLQNHRL